MSVCNVFIHSKAFSLCFIPIIVMCSWRILIQITYLLTYLVKLYWPFKDGLCRINYNSKKVIATTLLYSTRHVAFMLKPCSLSLRLSVLMHCNQKVQQKVEKGQGRSDGGYIGIYPPPPQKKNQSTLQIFMWLYWLIFFSLTQEKFDIVPVCALARVSFTYLHTTIYTPPPMKFLATPLKRGTSQDRS